jgi:pimeloyl-ACP methyl ester carboxylesterase
VKYELYSYIIMYMFGKLLPLLFTSPSSVRNINISNNNNNNNNNNNAVYQRSNVVLQESTLQELDTSALESSSSSPVSSSVESSIESSVSAPRKIINDVKSVYADLASGCYSTKDYYSPMIEFKYMSPTHIRDSFTTTSTTIDIDADADTDSAATDLNQVFQQIKSQSYGKNDNNDDNDTEKTIAIYLPGLDGVGISATTQFDDLSNQYEFWRMYINDKDTTTSYTDLTTIITKFVTDLVLNNNGNENRNGKGRKFILIGESFGGLLVPTVALRLQSIFKKMDTQNKHKDSESYNDLLQGLVLVNPATSFDQTQWSTIVPLLASLKYLEQQEEEQKSSSTISSISSAFQLPTPYSVVGGMALAATIPDKNQFQTILDIFSNTKVTTSDELRDVLQSMTDGFGILADKLPADVMEHRVNNWLNVGCMLLNSNSGNNGYGDRLGTLDVETLVIAGEDDNMLPVRCIIL